MKELVQEKEDIPPDQQHITLCLRDGMYHFTNGRQDFDNLMPYNSVEAVQNVLAFNPEDVHRIHHVSSTELQEFVIQTHTILAILYRETAGIMASKDIPHLRNIVLPTAADDASDKDSEDDDDGSNNQ
jgi:hypothetical protein